MTITIQAIGPSQSAAKTQQTNEQPGSTSANKAMQPKAAPLSSQFTSTAALEALLLVGIVFAASAAAYASFGANSPITPPLNNPASAPIKMDFSLNGKSVLDKLEKSCLNQITDVNAFPTAILRAITARECKKGNTELSRSGQLWGPVIYYELHQNSSDYDRSIKNVAQMPCDFAEGENSCSFIP